MIICTCGCKVDDMDEVIDCAVKSWSRECTPAVSYVSYCPQCYEHAKQNGELLNTELEEMNWLNHGTD